MVLLQFELSPLRCAIALLYHSGTQPTRLQCQVWWQLAMRFLFGHGHTRQVMASIPDSQESTCKKHLSRCCWRLEPGRLYDDSGRMVIFDTLDTIIRATETLFTAWKSPSRESFSIIHPTLWTQFDAHLTVSSPVETRCETDSLPRKHAKLHHVVLNAPQSLQIAKASNGLRICFQRPEHICHKGRVAPPRIWGQS
jgi:hypothetical protein